MTFETPGDGIVAGLAAIGGAFAVIAVLTLVLAVAPAIAWFCLNFVAGFGLSFWQCVGIGWFASFATAS